MCSISGVALRSWIPKRTHFWVSSFEEDKDVRDERSVAELLFSGVEDSVSLRLDLRAVELGPSGVYLAFAIEICESEDLSALPWDGEAHVFILVMSLRCHSSVDDNNRRALRTISIIWAVSREFLG